MRNNDAITFEIGRRDLEVILGNLSLTIAKMERTQEALKDAADLIRDQAVYELSRIDDPAVLKKLLASGMSADEILEKLK